MPKIKSLDDLKKLRSQLHANVELREKGSNSENLVKIRVSMATCGIASGAKEVMNFIIEESNRLGIDNVVVTQTGCMGYCYAEPTIDVTLPGKDAVTFGHVDKKKATEILESYVKNGVLVDGIIPVNYKTVEKE